MELLGDPQAWLSFALLATLEVVLGIDNVVFLSLTVERLPVQMRRRARIAGLSLAMLTRIALLLGVVGLAAWRRPLLAPFGFEVSPRDLVLFAGGVFLVLSSVLELRGMGRHRVRRPTATAPGMRRVILRVALGDILFSFDSVFSAVGLASRLEVMVAAIVLSLPVMLGVSAVLERLIERHRSIKVLALGFLALVGLYLMAAGMHVEIGRGYLYAAMAVAVAAEVLNIVLRSRR